MIKANELRIGNWVMAVGDKWEATIDTKNGDYIQVGVYDLAHIKGCNFRNESPSHEPIPITPEILGKIGFKFDGDWNYQKGNLILHDMTDTEIKCFEVYWQYPKDIMVVANFLTIQHLHQLQNLYFALTGEELLITL